MLRLDDFDAIHDFHQTGLESLGLPGEAVRTGVAGSLV